MGCNGVGDSGILAMQGRARSLNPAVLPFKVRSLNRHLLPLIIFAAMGCNSWTLEKMYAPIEVPSDTRTIDPWIAKLLASDVPTATQLVKERLHSESQALAPLIKRMSEFTPCQICFSSGVGHVRCVRRWRNPSTSEYEFHAIYLAQPPDDARRQDRLNFYEPRIRPLMSEFLSRFAGAGEDIAGGAGSFAFSYFPTASDYGYRDEDSLGDWKGSRLFYMALNGDGVFIKPNGQTAWRVLETDETIPISDSLEGFITAYAEFLASAEVFDSWAYREFIGDRTKR